MKTRLFAALGAGALITASAFVPAAAQVRGYSAVGPSGSTRVDVNVSVQTSDQYRDDRDYRDSYYDDRRDPYYDDRYSRGQSYNDRYYEDTYYNDRRRGEVYYPARNSSSRDNSGEVIAGVLVGAIIGYALADDNDHHHYKNNRRSYNRYDRRSYKRSHHRHSRHCGHRY